LSLLVYKIITGQLQFQMREVQKSQSNTYLVSTNWISVARYWKQFRRSIPWNQSINIIKKYLKTKLLMEIWIGKGWPLILNTVQTLYFLRNIVGCIFWKYFTPESSTNLYFLFKPKFLCLQHSFSRMQHIMLNMSAQQFLVATIKCEI
jgi:hypothetical protein